MSKLLLVAILILVNGFNLLFIEHCYADSNKAEYELQERCGNKADKWFKAEFGNGYKSDKDGQWLYNYQNHYNKKLNKCFITFTSTHLPNDKKMKGFMSKQLFDINENKEYGGYAAPTGAMKPMQCVVQDTYCNSEGEWDALVKPYMEQ
jgi:hypothetical protein